MYILRPSGVVPLVGTWIETQRRLLQALHILVVPLVGTWIETIRSVSVTTSSGVVPLVGTWIETSSCTMYSL